MAENLQMQVHELHEGVITHFLICKLQSPSGKVLKFYTRPRMMTVPLNEHCVPVDVDLGLQEMDAQARYLFYIEPESRA